MKNKNVYIHIFCSERARVSVEVRRQKKACKCHLDPAEHAGIEDVYAGVNLVGDEDLGLLDEALDPPVVRVEHHHAVLRRLLHPRDLHTQTRVFHCIK